LIKNALEAMPNGGLLTIGMDLVEGEIRLPQQARPD